ncbi:MAG: diacylglycerol kinase [Micrococcales bacterium]|nr:MAG: diacylglycerol kinase [Micrococcales bacterium]PIE26980.1 MAG: diacylglycerol kinase [Micrococcales bacterium]
MPEHSNRPCAPVTVVAAVARNGVIGAGNAMPWRLPADLRRFKELTMGGVLIMGRATYESIGRPLPGRTTVVITRAANWAPADGSPTEGPPGRPCGQGSGTAAAGGLPRPAVRRAASLEHALDIADELDKQAFVVGGGQIYRLALPVAHAAELTEIDLEPAGDTTFPVLGAQWHEVSRDQHDEYAFVRYERDLATSP